MRLIRLRLRAFGPYAAEQVIDFERLTGSGLFLLEGPTGAGKSTILDAVTFALYGGLAGENASTDRLQSHFADPSVEPSVSCEFSLRGVTYRVERAPEHTRPKKRGDGFTTAPSRVHLERLEAGGWVSLSANKAEAGEMITEFMGLNRDQFTQVMLLPQGEFARFLRAGDDDRRAVLTRLFGAGLYEQITRELDRGRAEAMRAREESGRRIDAAVSAAAEAAGLDGADRAELLDLSAAERAVRCKETADALAAGAAAARDALALAQQRLAAAVAADERARRDAELMTRLADSRARLAAHVATREAYDRDAAMLAQARQAAPVRPLLESLDDALRVTEQARSAVRELVPGASAGLGAAGGAGRGEASASGWAVCGEGGPGDGGAEPSWPDAERVAELARERAAGAEAAEREAAGLQHLVDAEAGLAGQRAELAALEQAAGAAAGEVARLEEARSDLPARIARLEGELHQASAQAAGLEPARLRLEKVSGQRDAAARAAALGEAVSQAQAALQVAVDAHQAAVDEHQALVEARLTGIAAELAATLAAGEPCPVCGATVHPSPAAAHADAVSAADVSGAAARRDQLEAQRRQCEAEHAGLAQQEAACLAVSKGRPVGELDNEAAILAGEIEAAEAAARDAAGLQSDLAQARAELESSAGDLRAATQREATAREQAALAERALAALAAQCAEAASGYPCVADRQAALSAAAAHDRGAARALETFAAALAGLRKCQEQAEREALGRAFASLAEARAAVVPAGELERLEAAVASWGQTLAALTAAASADEFAGLDPASADAVRATALAAAAEVADAQEADKAARSEHDATARRSRRFGERLEEVRRAEEAHDRLVESTEAVIRLAGLAKGVEGHQRMALTTYVLRHWFAQVVAAANLRLSAMSSGRYELKRTDQGQTRRERSGLTLAVVDRHTGEDRSPASLSGGETFYTSLALALGLADVVKAEAGGVDLDTLFIDEGFGSLDAETLDQVMAVIDDLRDRGRVVGIVSHVADLKDRIPERLEVRRLPDGSSAVRVVA